MSYYDPDDYLNHSRDMNGRTLRDVIQDKEVEESCPKNKDVMECIEVVERLAEVYRKSFETDGSSGNQEREDFHHFVMEGLDKCMEMRRSSFTTKMESGSSANEFYDQIGYN